MMKTELQNYTLYYDGTIGCTEDQLCFFLMERRDLLSKVCVEEITPNITLFNDHNNSKVRLTVKKQIDQLKYDWLIDLPSDDDVTNMVLDRVDDYILKRKLNTRDEQAVLNRVMVELSLFKRIGKWEYLKTLISIISEMREQGVVWNGRGSAASSFVLFLIGVHRVDSYLYNLPLEEFFKVSN